MAEVEYGSGRGSVEGEGERGRGTWKGWGMGGR